MVEQLKRHWIRLVVSLLIVAFYAVHAAQWQRWSFIEGIDSFAYDARLLFTMPGGIDDRIVIVDVDEKSLAEEGRWPWSRARLALLVDQLFDHYGIAILAFDMLFAEPEEVSGLRVLEEIAGSVEGGPALDSKIEELKASLDHDANFARSLENRAVVLGYFFENRDAEDRVPMVGKLPEPLLRAGSFTGRNVPIPEGEGFAANLGILQDAAVNAGHFLTIPDSDGTLRRLPLLWQYENDYYESLSLAVARMVLDVDRVTPGFPQDSQSGRAYSNIEWINIGPARVPVDEKAAVLVPFRGRQGSFPYVSASDVISGKEPVETLRDRVVFFGTSAKGLFDLRATPVQPDYPGVEAHANVVAGILDGVIKENPAYTLGAEVILIVLTGLLMAFVLPIISPAWATVTTIGILGGIIGVNLWIWESQNFVFPIAAGLLTVLTMFLFNMTYGYFFEQRSKRQIAGLFGQYVPPELVDEMSENPDEVSMESESRELTVLFSDVRGFTTISEGLQPRELSDLMNGFLTPMTGIIHEHRGTIDKYMGDAIMAFWGAPLGDGDHARHALEAALDMIDRLEALQEEFSKRGWPPIKIGVGLNTGPMAVGNMGSEFRMAYTVLGDAVNLGSRLEGLTKSYGVQIIVNETTATAVPDYVYRELDRVRVKGKDEPVTIYEPIGPRDVVDKADRDEIKLYREVLRQYRAQEWDMAEIQILNLQKAHPDRLLYEIYAERIAHYRMNPPPTDWDGVFTHTTK